MLNFNAYAVADAYYAASDREANQHETADIVRRMLGDNILELTKNYLT